MFAAIPHLELGLGPCFMEKAIEEDKGHVTEATQLMAGLEIRALDFKPREPALRPHGNSNKRPSALGMLPR